MRVNRQIRVPNVRLIDKDGNQMGVVATTEALRMAEKDNLDLVEVSATAHPPVCKIIDYGKFRYQQTKKDKESKKAQHQVKVKEIKVKPNTDDHDLQTKLKKARDFIEKGDKVRVTCMFRGREMAHPEIGRRIVQKVVDDLADIGTPEAMAKQMGRNLSVTIAPGVKKSKETKREDKNEAEKGNQGAI